MTTTVDFSQLHPAAHATWTAIGRLVMATDTRTWAVVGGQMVAIHATVWGVELPRATDDGDIVVDVRTFARNALRHVADALVADGFDSEQSPQGIVRFTKGDAKIDLHPSRDRHRGTRKRAPSRSAPRTCSERSSRSQQLRPRSCPQRVSTRKSMNGISPPF